MTEEYREKILKDRRKEYGDYAESIKTISFLKERIKFAFYYKKNKWYIPFTYYSLKESETIQQHIDFTKTMLALKASRSIHSKGEAYKDCIVDFLNYMILYKEAMNNIIGGYKNDVKIIINFEEEFNQLLNKTDKNIDYLLEEKFLKKYIS